jgi:hypothetical protein
MTRHFFAAASAAALLLAAGAASAQSVIAVQQRAAAVGSTLTADQSTSLNGAIQTIQEGQDSDIAITQEFGSGATAYVHQGSVVGSSATITQIDGHARAVVSQFGGVNPGSGEVRVRQLFGGGEFDENETTVYQFGASGSLALVEQVGDSQTTFIRQSRTLPGTTADILQVGGANAARIEQSEGESTVTVTQGALGHSVYFNDADVTATGVGNEASIYQGGDGAVLVADIGGSDNYLHASQVVSAEAAITQNGEDNRIVLTQTSDNVSAVLSQLGSGNVMTILQ